MMSWVSFFKKPITIRRSLIRHLVILILVTTGAILAVIIIGSNQNVADLSRLIIRQSTTRAETELQSYFKPVEQQLELSTAFVQRALPAESTLELNWYFMRLMTVYPRIAAVTIANNQGLRWRLWHEQEQWKTQEIKSKGSFSQTTTWQEAETILETRRDEDSLFFHPWIESVFQENQNAKSFWVGPHIVDVNRGPVLTVATSYVVPDRLDENGFIAFDILLEDLSDLTRQLQVSENGSIFMMTENGRMIGMPNDPRFKSQEGIRANLMRDASEVGAAPLTKAVKHWASQSGGVVITGPYQFSVAQTTWWAGFQPFRLGERTFWIGVIVPEGDLLTDISRNRLVLFVIIVIALILAVSMAVWLAKRYSEPLEQLVGQSQRIGRLDFSMRQPVNAKWKEIKSLADAQQQTIKVLESFSRYVPMDIVKELINRDEVAQIGGRTEFLTVLFTDIQDFTTIAEKMSPVALTQHMASYFEAMLDIFNRYQGTVDKFVGDGIVGFWGAPKTDEQHAAHAVQTVLECCEKLKSLNQEWEAQKLPPLPTRFGLNSGSAIVGNVGTKTRLNYTVLGDAVNVASRIEELNEKFGTQVLASESVFQRAREPFVWRYVAQVTVKGKHDLVRVYEPLGVKGKVSTNLVVFAREYERGMALYEEKAYRKALDQFESLAKAHPLDRSVSHMIDLCTAYLQGVMPD